MTNKEDSIIPVVLFAYARTEHLLRTLEGLKINNVPRIYAFSDGPRTDGQVDAVNNVRAILKNVDWCDIKIVERKENLGLGVSVRTGVAEVFEEHDKVIVVEDDIVLYKGAYKFIRDALQFYENDPNVMSVSLWSHPLLVPKKIKDQVFFCPRFNCWGWGTYKMCWNGMNRTALDLLDECKKKKININRCGKDFEIMAKNEKKRNLWAIRFALLHLVNNKVNVWPTRSWVENIGIDGSGTNFTIKNSGKNKYSSSVVNKIDSPVYTFPSFLKENFSKKQFVRFLEGNIFQRFIAMVKKTIMLLLKRVNI